MPKFEMPKFEMPNFELPKFELPEIDLPEIDLPSVEQLTACARDAAYVGVGLAAMTVERVQALQQQLLDVLKEQLAKVSTTAD